MKKRLLSTILLCAIVLSQAACGSENSTQNDTTTASGSGETTAEPVETEVSDNLPDVTFGGRTFTTLTADYLKADYVADEANGDVINDAVYKRNETVMERFDVVLETNYSADYNQVNNVLSSSVMAGDDEYQLVSSHVVRFSGLAMNDILMNWYDIPHIDFDKPWWSNSNTEDLTYNGVALLAVGDYALSALGRTYCYFYDKKAAENYHFEDLYSVVYDGNWTLDYLNDVCKNIYVDINGNGQRDENDYYGATFNMTSDINAYLWSCGNKIFTKNAAGKFDYTYNNEHTVDILEKLYKLSYENEGVCTVRPQYSQQDVHTLSRYSFRDDLTAFIPGLLNYSIEVFRDRKNEYGILPYPKFDAEQEEYYTMVDGGHAALGIPKSVTDLEFVGVITEALNAESNKIVFPAYYEIALKVKYTHDNESVKMLDMIVENRIFDFGYVYDNWRGVSFFYQGLLGTQKSTDFTSYYASKGSSAESYYNTLLEYFDSIAENG